jgi:choline kinase
MRIIILAAGEGNRLRPYTYDTPKCMVELHSKPLLEYQLDVFNKLGIPKHKQAIICGYLKDKIQAPNVTKFFNHKYNSTNMVYTLFCAREWMKHGEDLLISYGDIVYKPEILQKIIDCNAEICLSADLAWLNLWSMRMENPLLDAETFKTDKKSGKIIEVGKKPLSLNDIEAQYMGIIKIRSDKVDKFIDFYNKLDKKKLYDGKNFNNMYMTSLIQLLINANWEVMPSYTNGGWLEIDTFEDLELYNSQKLDIL